MIRIIGICIFFLCLLSGCGDGKSKKIIVATAKNDFSLPYDVNSPTQTIELPIELTEISGLTYSQTSNTLLAINDEEGIVYVLDTFSGKVIDEIEFGKADDYEGIASHDGYIYIAESNGNVKVVKEESKKKIIEFDDRLSGDNDIEGMCYDPKTQTLLLAAKGDSETEGNTRNFKSIFTMSINNGAVRKQPYIQINMKESYQSMNSGSNEGIINKMSNSSKLKKYGPSGIAIDPKTNFIYLLSSNSKTIAVLDHNGIVKTIIMLDKSLHAQPEGITFDNRGNLYISNEGKRGVGVIHKYSRKD